MKKNVIHLVPGLLALAFVGCATLQPQALSAADMQAMRAAAAAYADAWLSNDPERVMAVFVPEPVLSPSGLPFVEGQAAAREFWWPVGAPPLTVREFVQTEREAGGAGDRGFVRGTFRLAFDYGDLSRVNTGKYLSLMMKMPDGTWRISHQIWDDFPQPVDR